MKRISIDERRKIAFEVLTETKIFIAKLDAAYNKGGITDEINVNAVDDFYDDLKNALADDDFYNESEPVEVADTLDFEYFDPVTQTWSMTHDS